ncbi:tetratricopeptide repeat protein [Leeia sp.]|uniref:tetratricopeptide repeat protein n=1 Tax=Leeia sp. TaxID=2884678 RepID=UPI0035B188B8
MELLQSAQEAIDDLRFSVALPMLEVLASRKVSESFLHLGYIYKSGGDGVEVNLEKAKYYYDLYFHAMEADFKNGNYEAGFRVALAYQFGDGVKKDEKKAVKILVTCVKHNHAKAQYHLSGLYAHGWCGLKKNQDERLLWLFNAAENNCPEALYEVGLIYCDGDDGDKKMGMDFIKRAASLSFFPACDYINGISGKD